MDCVELHIFNILFGAIFDYGTDTNWKCLKIVEKCAEEKLSAPQCASLCCHSAAQMLAVEIGE